MGKKIQESEDSPYILLNPLIGMFVTVRSEQSPGLNGLQGRIRAIHTGEEEVVPDDGPISVSFEKRHCGHSIPEQCFMGTDIFIEYFLQYELIKLPFLTTRTLASLHLNQRIMRFCESRSPLNKEKRCNVEGCKKRREVRSVFSVGDCAMTIDTCGHHHHEYNGRFFEAWPPGINQKLQLYPWQ